MSLQLPVWEDDLEALINTKQRHGKHAGEVGLLYLLLSSLKLNPKEYFCVHCGTNSH